MSALSQFGDWLGENVAPIATQALGNWLGVKPPPPAQPAPQAPGGAMSLQGVGMSPTMLAILAAGAVVVVILVAKK